MTEAIVLVGGKGTRLRPLTVNTPKPILPVAGVPLLDHLLARAKAVGVTRVVFATSYRAEVFEAHYGDGADFGLDLVYVTEVEPLDTGGAIRNVADQLASGPDDPVVIFNSDILTGADLGAQLREHADSGADVTLHLTTVDDPRAFGLVPTDADGWVTAFLEKPQRPEEIVTHQINAGCYVFRRSVIDGIPTGRRVSVERETFPGLLAAGAKVRGFVESSYWLDLGTPAAFARGSADLVLGTCASVAVPASTRPDYPEALVLPGAEVAATAKLSGGTVVSPGAVIGPGADIAGSVINADAVVEADVVLRDAIVGRAAHIGRDCVLDGTVVGDGAVIGARNELRGGARLWCDVNLPPAAIRFSTDV
jgi:mannose-1-phosphate guanylyltransferase